MYAVIKTGGKQYRVTAGQILEVEKLEGNIGDSITLSEVLLVADGEDVTIGQPSVDGASVLAKITGQYRGKKILSFRYRPKKRIRVRRGHRQYLTRLAIESVSFGHKTYDVAAAEADSAAQAEAAAPMGAALTTMQAAVADVQEEAETVAGAASELVESVVDSVADVGTSVTEAVSQAAESAVDTVAETASGAVEAAVDIAESAGEAMADAASSAAASPGDAVANAIDSADDDDKENA